MTTDTKPLFPRSLTPLLVLMLIVTAAVSCNPTPTEESSGTSPDDLESVSPSGQVIVFWYPHTQGQEQALLTLIDEFNHDNEWDITVIGEYAGATDDIYDKIRARIGSGALPGIVVAEQHQTAAYAVQDVLVALAPYVESERWGYTQEEMDDFLPIALAAEALPQFEDRYGWPTCKSTEVLYYNEDWLAELGHTEPPKTWDEFEEMACAASDPEVSIYGYEFSIDASTFADMLSSRGGHMINEDATAYAFDGPEGLESLIFLQTLLIEGCTTLKTEQSGDRADFGAGKVLFTIDSSSNLPYYRSSVTEGAGFNWSISPLPTSLGAPKVQVHGPSLLIFKATPEKQLAAWLFLRWFAEPEQQARWARATNTFPIRVSTTDLLQDTFAENPQYEKAFSFLDCDVATEPGVTGYGECRDAIDEMLRAVANLEHPETWLASTVAACNGSLEEAAQQ